MKTVGIITLTLALLIAGCGGDSEGPSGATGEEGAVATEEMVTDSFTEWRYQRASKVGDGEITVTIDDVSCNLGSPGEATCYETLTLNSVYGTKNSQSLLWEVEYDEETGEIVYAKESSK